MEIWIEQNLHLELTVFNIAISYGIPNGADTGKLIKAVDYVFAEEEALYARLTLSENYPRLLFDPANAVRCAVVDLSDEPAPDEKMLRIMREQADRPFDMRGGEPLVRPFLFTSNGCPIKFFCVYNHLINDAWGVGLVFERIAKTYATLEKGEMPTSSGAAYQSFLKTANEGPGSEYREKAIAFWKSILSSPVPEIRPIRGKTEADFRCAKMRTAITRPLANKLAEMAGTSGATLFHQVLLAWGILMEKTYKTGGHAINIPLLNRSKEYRETVGFFVETRTLPLPLDMDATAAENLKATSARVRELFRHYELPNGEIAKVYRENGNSGRFASHTAISFVKKDYHAEFDGRFAQSDIFPTSRQSAPFTMYVMDVYRDRDISVDLDYRLDYMSEIEARLAMDRFVRILELLAENPATRPCDMDIASESERRAIKEFLRRDIPPAPCRETVADAILRHAETTPDAIAVEEGDKVVTYKSLVEKSRATARLLSEKYGVGRGDCIPLLLPRGIHLIRAELAAMLTGAAFAPLDVDSPAPRLRRICEDCAARCILTDATHAETARGIVMEIVDLDARNEDTSPFSSRALPEDVAYVIHTSGSTGRPKGVEITHEALARYLESWMKSFPQAGLLLEGGRRKLMFHSPSFDASIEDIFPTLVTGNTIVTAPHPQWPAHEIGKILVEKRISIIHFPPAFLIEFLKHLRDNRDDIKGHIIKICHSGGDVMPPESALLWNEIFGDEATLSNVYGPTEITVSASAFIVPRNFAPLPGIGVPIGRLHEGRSARIVDERGRDAPIGVEGELLLGGIGLAKGYRNLPEKTASQFVISDDGARYYRTGDIVKLLPDGDLAFLRREDSQVKILGHRIELGEIQSCLMSNPNVAECAAVVRARENTGEKRLLAFVSLCENSAVTARALREYAMEKLPGYMIPQIAIVSRLPRSVAGKVDRKALDEISVDDAPEHAPGERAAMEIAGPVRQYLATLWERELGRKVYDAGTDFFELGGDSISAARLVAATGKAFRTEYPFAHFFANPTIEATEKKLERLVGGRAMLEKMAALRIELGRMKPEEMRVRLAAESAASVTERSLQA